MTIQQRATREAPAKSHQPSVHKDGGQNAFSSSLCPSCRQKAAALRTPASKLNILLRDHSGHTPSHRHARSLYLGRIYSRTLGILQLLKRNPEAQASLQSRLRGRVQTGHLVCFYRPMWVSKAQPGLRTSLLVKWLARNTQDSILFSS